MLRLRSLLCLSTPRGIGFTAGRSLLCACFHARGSSWFVSRPSPEQFDPLGSSFLAFAPPQSSFASPLSCASRRASPASLPFRTPKPSFEPLAVFRHEPSPTRVSALFMTSLERVHFPRDFPRLVFVPSSGALSLSTVFSALELAGLFHPAAMFRTSPFRGFSLPAAAPVRHGPLPPCRFLLVRSPFLRGYRRREVACRAERDKPARFRPAATNENPGSEALLHRESRGRRAGF